MILEQLNICTCCAEQEHGTQENLNKSSIKWHEHKHNIEPWLIYFLETIIQAYREFAERAEIKGSLRGTKTSIIISIINNQIGDFIISDIMHLCPGVSRPMIRVVLENLRSQHQVKLLGKGRNARWKRM